MPLATAEISEILYDSKCGSAKSTEACKTIWRNKDDRKEDASEVSYKNALCRALCRVAEGSDVHTLENA